MPSTVPVPRSRSGPAPTRRRLRARPARSPPAGLLPDLSPIVDVSFSGDGVSVTDGPLGLPIVAVPVPLFIETDLTVVVEFSCDAFVLLYRESGPLVAGLAFDGVFETVVPAGLVEPGLLVVEAVCADSSGIYAEAIGEIVFYVPGGTLSDAETGGPVDGAQVWLFQVPGWTPGPGGAEADECQNDGGPWGQPAPTDLGVLVDPEATAIEPGANPFIAEDGFFGWALPDGCWYVEVMAEGYQKTVGPVVGVPPELTNLHLDLYPVGSPPLEARDDTAAGNHDGGPIEIDLFGNDTFDSLADLQLTEVEGGTADCTFTRCTFTPFPNTDGLAGFVYTITDIHGGRDSATVTVEVNGGPSGGERFVETFYGAEPTVLDGLEGAVDPEGDEFTITNAFIVDGVGDFSLDGTTLIYTPPPVKDDPRNWAEIHVFYEDEFGASGVGMVFVTIEDLDPPVCQEIVLASDALLVNDDGESSFVVDTFDLPCEYYFLELTSSDPRHEPGYQVEQVDERFMVTGLDFLGGRLYVSPPTPDLPEDERSATTTFGPIDPTGISSWYVAHVGEGTGPNSVYATARLVPVDEDTCHDDQLVVEDRLVLNRDGRNQFTVPTPAHCLALYGGYGLRITTSDGKHRAGYQTDQTEEQVVVEGLDAFGTVVYTSPVTQDLADDETSTSIVDQVDDRGAIVSWRVRHASSSEVVNSVYVSVELLYLD